MKLNGGLVSKEKLLADMYVKIFSKKNIALIFVFIFLKVTFSFSQSLPYISSSLEKIRIITDYWYVTRDSFPDKTLSVLDNSQWQAFTEPHKYNEGNWILKTHVHVEDSTVMQDNIGLFTRHFITAYEIYWNDERILKSGEIGTDRYSEKPGLILSESIIPSELLKPGNHTLYLRISNYNDYTKWKWYNGQISIGRYSEELKNSFQFGYMIFLTAGIMIIPFLLNLLLYIGRGALENLLFCLVCLITLIDRFILQIPYFFNSPSTYVHLMMYTFAASRVLRSILFPAFFAFLFSFPHSIKLLYIITLINVILALFVFDFHQLYIVMTWVLLIESALITLWAIYNKKNSSYIIALGIVVALVVVHFEFRYMGAGSVLAVFSVLAIGKNYIEREKEEHEAKLRAARLEIELLKKTINPHFLLNSLASIIALLRNNPDSAIKFIIALSREFRIVSNISSMKLIPIKQEIDLCRYHLEVMSYRKQGEFELVTYGIKGNEEVPPMIFHTIIENGLTHGFQKKRCGKFTIRKKVIRNVIKYIITHDGENKPIELSESSGIGMKYVKTRLEESYPNRWSIVSESYRYGWRTIIEIK